MSNAYMTHMFIMYLWIIWDSNPGPSVLLITVNKNNIVELMGFEPITSCLQNRRSTN